MTLRSGSLQVFAWVHLVLLRTGVTVVRLQLPDSLGLHGLSCYRSAGRIAWYATINHIIRRALVSAGVPAVLEPNGLVRDDGEVGGIVEHQPQAKFI